MSDKFTLDVVQASELKHAWARNGGTNADLKTLCEGDLVANILLYIRGRAEIVLKPILKFVRTWTASAQVEITTSEKYFEEAGVVWMGDNFKAQFIDLEVPATDARELAVLNLEEKSLDAPILAELKERAEISVSHFREFLNKHRNSKEWLLFYLRGKDGDLWAVDAYWDVDGRGWNVSADSISDPSPWGAGRQVVSRKDTLTS